MLFLAWHMVLRKSAVSFNWPLGESALTLAIAIGLWWALKTVVFIKNGGKGVNG